MRVRDRSIVARRSKPFVGFELAGVEFIHENGGGPGVRLRKRRQKKALPLRGNSPLDRDCSAPRNQNGKATAGRNKRPLPNMAVIARADDG